MLPRSKITPRFHHDWYISWTTEKEDYRVKIIHQAAEEHKESG